MKLSSRRSTTVSQALMSVEAWTAIILGAAGAVSGVWTVYTNIRDRDSIVEKQTGEVKLDRASQKHIAAQAAAINSEERIETERWWKEQFDAVKVELQREVRFRRRVNKHIRQHQAWDQLAVKNMRANNISIPDPPTLDVDVWDDDEEEEKADG